MVWLNFSLIVACVLAIVLIWTPQHVRAMWEHARWLVLSLWLRYLWLRIDYAHPLDPRLVIWTVRASLIRRQLRGAYRYFMRHG